MGMFVLVVGEGPRRGKTRYARARRELLDDGRLNGEAPTSATPTHARASHFRTRAGAEAFRVRHIPEGVVRECGCVFG
jgi:hypothetical protein